MERRTGDHSEPEGYETDIFLNSQKIIGRGRERFLRPLAWGIAYMVCSVALSIGINALVTTGAVALNCLTGASGEVSFKDVPRLVLETYQKIHPASLVLTAAGIAGLGFIGSVVGGMIPRSIKNQELEDRVKTLTRH